MPKHHSLHRSIFRNMLIITAAAILFLGYLLLFQEYKQYSTLAEEGRESQMKLRKQMLRTQVENAIDYINFNRDQVENVLKQMVRDRVNEIVDLMEALHEQNKEKHTPKEIEDMCYSLIAPLRYANGEGYYFAVDMETAFIEIYGVDTSMEDKPQWDLQDADGDYVVREMIEIAREKGEGFCSYSWPHPGHPEKKARKISYIKKVEPFNWLLGSGVYYEDIEKQIQEQVLARLSRIHFENDGYIFIGTHEGVSLSGPGQGQNMMLIEDRHGIKVVQALIEKARQGGGFVQYVMPEIDGQKSAPKLSYAQNVPEWGWYVGGGAYIDDIEAAYHYDRAMLRKDLYRTIAQIVLLIVLLLILAWLFSRRISARTQEAFSLFNRFFHEAETQSSRIDTAVLPFREFQNIGSAANRMVEERRKAQEALEKYQDQLEETVQQRTQELRATQEELIQKEKMATLGRLTMTVNHELRNPLGTIRNALYTIKTLSKKAECEGLERPVEMAERNIRRCDAIIEELLQYSRHRLPDLITVDIDSWIENALEEQNIPCDVQIKTRLRAKAQAKIDIHQFHRAFVNILNNAIQATHEDESKPNQIRIESHCTGAEIRISIIDNGPGIPEDLRERIFEPLFSTRNFGVGLGVPIVKEIMEAHGGDLFYECPEAGGAIAVLSLPKAEE
ncbi:MAG: cache domain-containing protein [Candidatus Sumerlaeia bacterium]